MLLFISRCHQCQTMAQTWQELAEKFHKTEDQAIVVATVDCAVEKSLCSGM